MEYAPLRTLLACSGNFLLSALVSFSFFFSLSFPLSLAGILADALSDADTAVDVLAAGVDVLAIEVEVLATEVDVVRPFIGFGALVLAFKASRWGKKLAGACQGYMAAEYMLASCESRLRSSSSVCTET